MPKVHVWLVTVVSGAATWELPGFSSQPTSLHVSLVGDQMADAVRTRFFFFLSFLSFSSNRPTVNGLSSMFDMIMEIEMVTEGGTGWYEGQSGSVQVTPEPGSALLAPSLYTSRKR